MALNNYDLILDIMYPTQEQTEVTRKMVTRNKYKESHSTYWKLQLFKFMYSCFYKIMNNSMTIHSTNQQRKIYK